jgi:uncharacterized membrane protein
MGFMNNDAFAIFMIALISILVSIVAILIYDKSFTPSKQKQDLEIINSYLRQLIVGYPL